MGVLKKSATYHGVLLFFLASLEKVNSQLIFPNELLQLTDTKVVPKFRNLKAGRHKARRPRSHFPSHSPLAKSINRKETSSSSAVAQTGSVHKIKDIYLQLHVDVERKERRKAGQHLEI